MSSKQKINSASSRIRSQIWSAACCSNPAKSRHRRHRPRLRPVPRPYRRPLRHPNRLLPRLAPKPAASAARRGARSAFASRYRTRSATGSACGNAVGCQRTGGAPPSTPEAEAPTAPPVAASTPVEQTAPPRPPAEGQQPPAPPVRRPVKPDRTRTDPATAPGSRRPAIDRPSPGSACPNDHGVRFTRAANRIARPPRRGTSSRSSRCQPPSPANRARSLRAPAGQAPATAPGTPARR